MSPRVIRRILFGKGVMLLLLCAVHLVAVPFEHARIRTQMPAVLGVEYSFWFGAIAVYFALLGVVDILASKWLEGRASPGWALALTSALFCAISSAIGLAILGVSPGILLLVSGLVELAVVVTHCPRQAETPKDSGLVAVVNASEGRC